MKTIVISLSDADELKLQQLAVARQSTLEQTVAELLTLAATDPLVRLQEQLSELRRDIATATHALLVANDIPAKDAEDFVRRELLGK